jgi:hypothetical protein
MVALPGFPEHEHGETEDEKQDEPLRVHVQGTGS